MDFSPGKSLAFKKLVQELQQETKDLPLPEMVETTAYFVISESLGNVARHSGATQAEVRLTQVDHDLIVEVQIGGPPCDTITAADVDEAPTQVTVTLWAGRVTGATCTDIPAMVGTARVRVPLVEPLGDRTLVQA